MSTPGQSGASWRRLEKAVAAAPFWAHRIGAARRDGLRRIHAPLAPLCPGVSRASNFVIPFLWA